MRLKTKLLFTASIIHLSVWIIIMAHGIASDEVQLWHVGGWILGVFGYQYLAKNEDL